MVDLQEKVSSISHDTSLKQDSEDPQTQFHNFMGEHWTFPARTPCPGAANKTLSAQLLPGTRCITTFHFNKLSIISFVLELMRVFYSLFCLLVWWLKFKRLSSISGAHRLLKCTGFKMIILSISHTVQFENRLCFCQHDGYSLFNAVTYLSLFTVVNLQLQSNVAVGIWSKKRSLLNKCIYLVVNLVWLGTVFLPWWRLGWHAVPHLKSIEGF